MGGQRALWPSAHPRRRATGGAGWDEPGRAEALLVVAAAAAALSATGCAANRLDPNDRRPAVARDQRVEDRLGGLAQQRDRRHRRLHVEHRHRHRIAPRRGAGEQDQPAISDRYIVWIDEGRLRAKDLSSGPVFNVTNGPATQADPALCGSVVVWTDTANNSDVYAKDLAGGSQIAVATSSAVEAYPACDAGRVVYMYAPIGSRRTSASTTSPAARPGSSPTSPGTSGGPRSPETGSSGRPGRTSRTPPRASRSSARTSIRARTSWSRTVPKSDGAGDLGVGSGLGGPPRAAGARSGGVTSRAR